MNNLLFKIAELEEKLENQMHGDSQLDSLIAETQLQTLEVFKLYPVRSFEESRYVLEKLNHIFGMNQ